MKARNTIYPLLTLLLPLMAAGQEISKRFSLDSIEFKYEKIGFVLAAIALCFSSFSASCFLRRKTIDYYEEHPVTK